MVGRIRREKKDPTQEPTARSLAIADERPPNKPPIILSRRTERGRRQRLMDLGEFAGLCELQATGDEIAAWFGLSIVTVNKYMQREPYKSIRADHVGIGKLSVRRQMFMHSSMPNMAGVEATKHLSKHYLGQTDKSAVELYGNPDKPLAFVFARADEKV